MVQTSNVLLQSVVQFCFQDFWCSPPANVSFSNLTDWLKMSGQANSSDRCHIYDVDYQTIQRSFITFYYYYYSLITLNHGQSEARGDVLIHQFTPYKVGYFVNEKKIFCIYGQVNKINLICRSLWPKQ